MPQGHRPPPPIRSGCWTRRLEPGSCWWPLSSLHRSSSGEPDCLDESRCSAWRLCVVQGTPNQEPAVVGPQVCCCSLPRHRPAIAPVPGVVAVVLLIANRSHVPADGTFRMDRTLRSSRLCQATSFGAGSPLCWWPTVGPRRAWRLLASSVSQWTPAGRCCRGTAGVEVALPRCEGTGRAWIQHRVTFAVAGLATPS
jgi:hypothetical protein